MGTDGWPSVTSGCAISESTLLRVFKKLCNLQNQLLGHKIMHLLLCIAHFLFQVAHNTTFYMLPYFKVSSPQKGMTSTQILCSLSKVCCCPFSLSPGLGTVIWPLVTTGCDACMNIVLPAEIPAAFPYVLLLWVPVSASSEPLSAFQQIRQATAPQLSLHVFQEVESNVFWDISDPSGGFSLGHHKGNPGAAQSSYHIPVSFLSAI